MDLWERSDFDKGSELYLGMDVGRKHDLTVFWLIERISGVLFTRQIIVMQNEKIFSPGRAALQTVEHSWAAPGLPRLDRHRHAAGRTCPGEVRQPTWSRL